MNTNPDIFTRKQITNEQIVAAYKETGSVWKAALKLGVTGQSVHGRLRAIGYKIGQANWTGEEISLATKLAEEGLPISRIAERLGRAYAGVACKLSRLGINHPYKPAKKVKRGLGLTKKKVRAFGKFLLSSGMSLTKAARANGMATTSLTVALQVYAPEMWAEFVKRNGVLPSRTCPGCGTSFVPLTSRQKACTGQCGGHARRDEKYFGGKRKNAVGLLEGICQLCELPRPHLAAHHVFGKENDPDNDLLIALCRGCHQIVGHLGKRKAATEPHFWENLITLAVVRRLADEGRKAIGIHATVDIEELEEEDLEQFGLIPAVPYKHSPIKDSEIPF